MLIIHVQQSKIKAIVYHSKGKSVVVFQASLKLVWGEAGDQHFMDQNVKDNAVNKNNPLM